MSSMFEILRVYPLLTILLVIGPLLGGFIGTYLGYDNLVTRLRNERQADRIEERADQVGKDLKQLAVPVESLRRYEHALQQQGQSFDLLRRVLAQYDQLQSAIAVRERLGGTQQSQERIASAEHILAELQALLGTAQTIPGPGGQALIIRTAPNTFRVTFAVPMRIPPEITFLNLPLGSEGHVIEKTKIGFIVVFTPTTAPVETFGFQASAEL